MTIDTEIESRKKPSDRLKTQGVAQKRALVVCEETGMCALIGEVLGSAGIEAVNLTKSVEAENQFHGDKFDVVLVDMPTPPEVGIELVEKIRKSGFNQKTPIIMISEDQRPGALSRAFEAGASFFVYKPIDKPHFVSLIRIIQGTIDHERRRFRRIPLQVRVVIKSDKPELEGETIDISMNGTLVRTPRTLPVGCLVEVSLFLFDGTKPIVGLGSVMRIINNNQMGILLDRLPIEEIGRLQEFLLPRITD
jgi:two-component system chemotaxis response regulator CheY